MKQVNNEEFIEDEHIKQIFKDLKHDYNEAKDAKTEIDNLIQEWNDLYYGIKRNNEGEILKNKPNKSSIVMKEIAKQIEWQKPNITEPFTSTRHPINLVDNKDRKRARTLEKWSNHEFTEIFDREEFIEQVADVILREGTVWVQTSWETKMEEEILIIPRATEQDLLANKNDPTEIEANEDGTFKVTYKTKKMTTNNPTSEVCRNEHVFPDPGARTEKEMRFLCYLDYMSTSDLRSISWLDKDAINRLYDRIDSEENEDTNLGIFRNIDGREYGYDDNYEPNDTARKHIKIVKYWGYYDMDNDGVAEPIMAWWSEKHGILLGLEENPMPDKSIPFDRSVYSARPFSLWGNALAFFLGDNQRAKTGIVRGIFDNMSLANNGQKFLMRGAVDYVNFKRMNNGERYIIVNKPNAIEDGSFNQLPSSVFNVLQMFTKESEELAGVSSGGPALSNQAVGKDGQQAQLTMSQQRMAALVRNISNLLRKVISKWITMAEVFLTDEQIQDMFTPEEEIDMNVFSISKTAKIKVRVGTEVNRNMKLQQYNMLMQQANALEGQLPPDALKNMVAEMFDLFDMHEEATKLRLYSPQPTQEQVAAQQLELENAMLENEKIKMQISVMEKDVEARYMNAEARLMEANANYGYKNAQSREKLAKAQSHEIENAIRPVQVEHELTKDNQNNNQGE